MDKTKQWFVYILTNTFEISAIVLYFFNFKYLANILPVYYTVFMILAVFILVCTFLIAIAFEIDKEANLKHVGYIKDYSQAIPQKLIFILELAYISTFASLTWYYCAVVVVVNLLLTTSLRSLAKASKDSILEFEKEQV